MKNKLSKSICIHGHFYQPPRENAWLEYIEIQESARPYHDWNERINFECYAPNASARILNSKGDITAIINNYEWINFNFGPTLLSWMEIADPDTYRAILEADKKSQDHFGGHGNAIAQAYNHTILPLSNTRDKETQIKWGIADFEYRFERFPEGMWLAETAVDTETLEILAAHGITYTILAPQQAKAFRHLDGGDWTQVKAHTVDTRRPYLCRLPSGNTISLFFYDGSISQEVAFNGLLNNGKSFAQRLLKAFDNNHTDQLVHIATDGETYGHHHRFGEMALADAIHFLRKHDEVEMTNYAYYLEHHPPEYEIQIHENSSWSCVHGVERWRSDCGCHTGGHGDWNQKWRKPLREALDFLRDSFIKVFEEDGNRFFDDVWAARNGYIDIVLNRGNTSLLEFKSQYCATSCENEDLVVVMRLLEMQRHAMLMYTSCGWFFDEISGLETTQILQYAIRGIQYAERITGENYQDQFMHMLEQAPSNLYENGAYAYKTHLLPNVVGFERVGMHYAVASVFERFPDELPLFNYVGKMQYFSRKEAGSQLLAIGRLRIRSKIIYSDLLFNFAVLYLGQQTLIGSLSEDMTEDAFFVMKEDLEKAFRQPNIGEVLSLMNHHFGGKRFSIWELFDDEKQRILHKILEKSMSNVYGNLFEIYEDNYQLMEALRETNIAIPDAYHGAAEFVINQELAQFFQQKDLFPGRLKKLANEIDKWNIEVTNKAQIEWLAGDRIYWEVNKVSLSYTSQQLMYDVVQILRTLKSMNIKPTLWKTQNTFFKKVKELKKNSWTFPNHDWKESFELLAKELTVAID